MHRHILYLRTHAPTLQLFHDLCSCFSKSRAWREATEPEDREHVTRYLYRQSDRFRVAVVEPPLG